MIAIILSLLVPLYLILVQLLRYRRVNATRQITRAQIQRDPQLAHTININAAKDLSTIFELGSAFGLFRTFGIAEGTKILCATKQFEHHCAKRYEDTDLLIREMMENPLNGTRSNEAIKRLNTIHGHYNIENIGYVYTLTVFVCEPIRWVEKYDWRPMSYAEQEAFFYAWQVIGEKMGIEDIPATLEECFAFNVDFEAKYMEYSKHNEHIARVTLDLFVSKLPTWLKPVFMAVFTSFLEDRVCAAVGFTPSPQWVKNLVYGAFCVRAWVIKYLMLPRWSEPRRTPLDKDPVTGRYMQLFNVFGNVYPSGYTLEDLGPIKYAKWQQETSNK